MKLHQSVAKIPLTDSGVKKIKGSELCANTNCVFWNSESSNWRS